MKLLVRKSFVSDFSHTINVAVGSYSWRLLQTWGLVLKADTNAIFKTVGYKQQR